MNAENKPHFCYNELIITEMYPTMFDSFEVMNDFEKGYLHPAFKPTRIIFYRGCDKLDANNGDKLFNDYDFLCKWVGDWRDGYDSFAYIEKDGLYRFSIDADNGILEWQGKPLEFELKGGMFYMFTNYSSAGDRRIMGNTIPSLRYIVEFAPEDEELYKMRILEMLKKRQEKLNAALDKLGDVATEYTNMLEKTSEDIFDLEVNGRIREDVEKELPIPTKLEFDLK